MARWQHITAQTGSGLHGAEHKRHGRGHVHGANGPGYDGDWQHGKKRDRGMSTFANGDRYDGEYQHGKKHGRGVSTFANGRMHAREWKDDQRDGVIAQLTALVIEEDESKAVFDDILLQNLPVSIARH